VKEASRRLFFALWPTVEQRARMVDASRAFVNASGGRVVAVSNLHVTLVFLGSVAERRVEEVAAIARRVAASRVATPPLVVSFERLEYWKRAQVLCAVSLGGSDTAHDRRGATNAPSGAVENTRGVGALAEALKSDLVGAGFAPDLKLFRAHVTLARKVTRAPSPVEFPPVQWSFEDYALVESRTEARESTYQALHAFSL
jgi:2'-5' RNA ligase